MSSRNKKRIAGSRAISHEDAKWQMATAVAGSGGAKGNSPGGQSAEEDKDTLQSRAFARVLDVISEGPIEGWVHPDNPLRDIYLDNTPIENPDSLGGWGQRNDGHTVTGSMVLEVPTDSFPLGPQGKPWKSEIVGRWIVGDFIPWGTQVASVETKRKLTMTQAATGGTGAMNQKWKLGGTLNFKNFEFQFRSGTQGQGYMDGFPAAENTIAVSVQVTLKTNPGPWTHLFGDPNLDAIRIDIRYPMLQHQDTTSGDIHGTAVQIRILVNGQEIVNPTDGYLGGKSSGPYIRTFKLELANIAPLPGGGWEVQVQRITDDSKDQALKNETWVDSYTEVIYGKLGYPNTAYIGLKMDSRHFSQIPVRAYMIKGLKVKIPSNYDPVTRIYTGTWDGNFKAGLAWTNNPAWCFYDMCINNRYGLGHFLIEASIDKWTLYQIGKYCDQLVPNGQGGQEPRFTCNLYIQKHEDAIKVLQDMSGIFRGMLCYINGAVTPVQDAPTDPSAYRMFSPANVINGQFSYSGTGMRARHNVALVSWSDLNDAGRLKQEYVEDHDGITKQGGITQLEITGFGCTSRAQARRIGLWAIYAEKILTDTVSFVTGMEGYFLKPGQLIQVQDPFRAGAQFSGRLMGAASTNTRLFLDRAVILQGGHQYVVSLLDPTTGLLVTKNVTQAAGTWSDITVQNFGFTPGPDADSVWQIGDNTGGGTLVPELFRVFAMQQKDEATIEVTALEYNDSLYGFVDFDHPLEEPPISILPGATQTSPPRPPFQVAVIQIFKPDHTLRQDLEMAWTATADKFLRNYVIRWRHNGGNWHTIPDIDVINARIRDALPGAYDLQVYAQNTLGIWSNPLERSATVPIPPTKVTGVAGLTIFGGGATVNGRMQFQTRDAHFTWRGSTGSGNGPEFFPEGPLNVNLPDPMARGFKVRIFNDDDQLWEENTAASEYTYTHDRNVQQTEERYGPGFGALRIFRIEVYVVFTDDSLSNPARLTVENPRPPPPKNVVTTVGNGFVAFQWGLPGAPDIDHFSLFASRVHDDPDPGLVAEFHGTSGIYYPPNALKWFYWLGTVDTFGNVSSNVPQGPPPGGTVKPPKFAPPGGTYQQPKNVTITEDTIGCTLTWARTPIGVAPTQWNVYGGPVYIGATCTLHALATQDQPPFETAIKKANYHIASNPGPQPGGLPAPWDDVDVGQPAKAGHADYDSGVFSVWGAGIIGGTGDKFNFVKRQPVAGNDIVMKVKMPTMGSGSSLGGLMARKNLTFDSPHVSLMRRATTGFIDLIQRNTAGGPTHTVATLFHDVPVWLRLRRIDDTIYGDYSEDGVNWLNIGSTTHPINAAAFFGMAMSSGVSNTLNVATFRNVYFSSTAPGPPPPPPAPDNDKYSSAIVLSGPTGTVAGTNVNATRQTEEPPGENTVWYRWTPGAGVADIHIGMNWLNIDVYTGTDLNAITLVASSSGDPSSVTWNALAGTTYKIRLSTNTRTSGFNMTYGLAPPAQPPPNDAFVAAALITGASGNVTGSNVNATDQSASGEPAGENTVWYRWTPGAGEATMQLGMNWLAIDIYTGSAVNGLTLIATSSGNPTLVNWPTVASTIYRIRLRKLTRTSAFNLSWIFDSSAPDNDNFAGATLLTGGSGSKAGTNVLATEQPPNEPPGLNTVWYRWNPPWDGDATFRIGMNWLNIDIYTGTTLANLVRVKRGTGDPTSVTWHAAHGTVYRIRLSKNTRTSNYVLTWSLTEEEPPPPPPEAPPNDNFAAAIVLATDNDSLVGTTVNATAEGTEPAPAGVESVWYKWTISAAWDATVRIGNDWSTIRIYTGSAIGGLTLIATSTGSPSAVTWRAVAGTAYMIRVYKNTRTSDFTLIWSLHNPAPANDAWASAVALIPGGAGGPVAGTNLACGTELGEPGVGAGVTASVWYKWTAPAALDTYMAVTPTGARIQAFTGTAVNALTEVTYSQADTDATGEGWMLFTPTAGVTYYIRISKRISGATGPFNLSWTQIPPPSNDQFGNALAVEGYAGGPLPGTTLGATRQPGEPTGDNSVWYRWTGTGFLLGVWAGNSDFTLEVYTGTAVNALTLVATSQAGIAWFLSTLGTAYSIRVRNTGVGANFNFYWYTPTATTPSFDPPGDFYAVNFPDSRKEVTLSTETPNAWIYIAYGRDPTPSDYDEFHQRTFVLLNLTEGTTDVRAIATYPGWVNSDVAQEIYTIEQALGPECQMPTFTPPSGTLIDRFPAQIQINCAEPEAAIIRYTLDGLIPGRGGAGTSTTNHSTVTMPQPGYLKAVAYVRGRDESPVAIGRFRLSGRTSAPTFSPGPGEYPTFPISVTITVPAQPGLFLRYTLDGSMPSDTNGILISSNTGTVSIVRPGTTLKAIAFGDGYINSAVTTGVYTGKVLPPTHTPDTIFYPTTASGQDVVIGATAPAGKTVNVRYRTDGKPPTRDEGTLLTTFPATITITGGYRELRSIAFVPTVGGAEGIEAQGGYSDSDIKVSIYDYLSPATPPI